MAKTRKETMEKHLKEKLIGATGSVSGATSILGSWQVCHNLCLGIIALLSIIGITVVGMPLLFLTKVALPLWIVAVILLLTTIAIYLKRPCISPKLIMFNTGLIIIGIPFRQLQQFSILFWSLGGSLAIVSIILFVKERYIKKAKTATKK